jgi:hypothetical protein
MPLFNNHKHLSCQRPLKREPSRANGEALSKHSIQSLHTGLRAFHRS